MISCYDLRGHLWDGIRPEQPDGSAAGEVPAFADLSMPGAMFSMEGATAALMGVW